MFFLFVSTEKMDPMWDPEVRIYSDFLAYLFESLNACIVQVLPQNPHLVYALLHDEGIFVQFAEDEFFGPMASNVLFVTEYFSRQLEQQSAQEPEQEFSYDNVMDAISKGLKNWKSKFGLEVSPPHFSLAHRYLFSKVILICTWSSVVEWEHREVCL
jgi:hypothetical protein